MADEKYVKRRRRGAVVYTPIAVLLIVIIVIFGMSVFFRISDIEVTGAEKYTVDQILSISGIVKGDNLIFLDTKAVSKKIGSKLAYLNEVVIDKIIPDKVVIKVTESQPIAVISYNGDWWIVDQIARALEKTDGSSAAEKMKINGIEPVSVAEGQKIIVSEDQQTKLQYLIDILTALNNIGIAYDVSMLDIANIGNISFVYSDRFTVKIGSGEDIDHKLVLMQQVIEQLEPDFIGKIDLTGENPHSIPS